MDEKLLATLSNTEKEIFKKGLADLIEQTYVIEEEYKKLNTSYTSLQDFIREMIEVQPNALWVLDESGEIFLQNSEAKNLGAFILVIKEDLQAHEIEYKNHFYLIKVAKHTEKTVVSATDITEEKRKERLASMGQVAAHLAHEIRNPIGSVALLASTLFKRVDIKSKPLVLEMRKAIYRVERIIKATLLFTKGLQANFTSFYLDELQNECQEIIQDYNYSKPINFDFSLLHVRINADKELLILVLQNFLYNAIDAIEEQEEDFEKNQVSIDYDCDALNHMLIIKDSGKSFTDKNILFEPFKTTKTKGHGLGLALSLQIMQAHNGAIELLESEKGFKILWRKKEHE
ncbi:MAG: GHKL domain-containing protein [Sulfurospirillum sp.]|nr:GHKL domain-containing protein [Sulfurospirillum sp.]